MPLILALLLLVLPDELFAATRSVGPGKTYATVCAALAAAANGDTIEIDARNASGQVLIYADDNCTFTQTGLTIKGIGTERAIIRRTSGILPASGSIWFANPAGASTLTIQHLEMLGAHNLTVDAAPVKSVNTSITYTDVYLHHNDNGIRGIDEALSGASRAYDLTVTNSEIAYNGGITEGTNATAVAHNINTGQCRNFTISGSWVHDSRGGNGIQSSCNTSTITYNRIADYPAGTEVYTAVAQPNVCCTGETNEELAFPIGGTAYLIGNIIYQSQSTRNYGIIHWHKDIAVLGQENSADELYVTNNTFVDAVGGIQTVGLWAERVTPTLIMVNNIFAGFVSGSVVYATGIDRTTQTTPANNLTYTTIAAAGFTDAANQNFHLGSGSAVNAATTDPGTVHSVNLNPVSNFALPLGIVARTSAGVRDMGAYEVNATVNNTVGVPVIWAENGVSTTTVRWTPALSENPIVGYTLYRNGTILNPTTPITDLSYVDTTSISPGSAILYSVSAETATDCGNTSNTASSGRIRQVSGTLDASLGWQELLGTKLDPTVPVDIVDRAGMAYDTQQLRLLIFSNAQTWASNAIVGMTPLSFTSGLVNASDSPLGTGGEIPAGGRPNGRQTRSGVAWLTNTNRLFVQGGRRTETGFLQDTWIWTPSGNVWTKKAPTGTLPDPTSIATAYDPLTGHVWVIGNGCLDEYDPVADSFTRPSGCHQPLGAHPQAVFDPVRRRIYVCAELTCGYYDLAAETFTALSDSGCVPLAVSYPGLAYDLVQNKIIGWIGGKTVYTLDPVTNTCSSQVVEGHPGYAPTFEVGARFSYAQDLNAFVETTTTSTNFFLLRLNNLPPIDVPPPPAEPRGLLLVQRARGDER